MSSTFVTFLKTAGYLGLFAGVFAETGFLIGIVLPGGETLVFAAGFLASLGYFNLGLVIGISFFAAVLADGLEYATGRKYGARMFHMEHSLFFNKEYINDAHEFYRRYGGKTIIAARFIPFVRTLAPMFAGIGEMPYPAFAAYNILGGALWVLTMSLLGYYLGKAIPNADQYTIIIILIVIVAASFAFSLGSIQRHRKRARRS